MIILIKKIGLFGQKIWSFSSFNKYKHQIFNSYFHLQDQQVRIEQTVLSQGRNIEPHFQKIQKIRQTLATIKQTYLSPIRNELENIECQNLSRASYLNSYVQLMETVSSHGKSSYIFLIICYYNIVLFYPQFVEHILTARLNPKRLKILINAGANVNYIWPNQYNYIDPRLLVEDRLCQFYNNLEPNEQISHLMKIQKIMRGHLTIGKKTYYQKYVQNYIESIKISKQSRRINIQQLSWLFYIYTQSMNDCEMIVAKMQAIISTQETIKGKCIQNLINAYSLRGQINQTIYLKFIKPHLLKNQMQTTKKLVQTLKFLILSESNDSSMILDVIKLINITYQSQRQLSLYDLHFCVHWLSVQGQNFTLPKLLSEHLIKFCKERSASHGEITKIIIDRFIKNKDNNKKIYLSQCLQNNTKSIRNTKSTKTSFYENQAIGKFLQRSKEQRVFQKCRFCCFQLDYCIVEQNAIEDAEIHGLQYKFDSGKIIRHIQLRMDILKHYGINIVYYKYDKLSGKIVIDQLKPIKPLFRIK